MHHEPLGAALGEAADTRLLIVREGAIDSAFTMFAHCFGSSPAVVVADERTMAVAGGAVEERLRLAGCEVGNPIVFPEHPVPYASFENVLAVESALRFSSAVPVAVGSGTINDITKLAAHRTDRQYMCVATASSMDGYAAFGAAITRDGFKRTMACPAPRAILADLRILLRAPSEMTSSGYGDLLGKVTAGADWILADALQCDPIEGRAWSLVQDSLRMWTARPDRLRAGDRAAIENLFHGLIMAGLAMQISQSSRPASGSEHRFSHLWEMQALGHGRPAAPHGFKVGVGTLAAAALYERILSRDLSRLDIEAACRAWPSWPETEREVRQAFDIPRLAERAVEETSAKYVDVGQLSARLAMLRARWPAIRERLQQQLMPAQQLRGLLQDAGCPTHPQEIGVTLSQLREAYRLARTIRRRYTVLDLAYEAGILADCVEELFAPGGFWADATAACNR